MKRDKVLHFLFGAIAAMVGLLAVWIAARGAPLPPLQGFEKAMVFCALCAAVGKEALDFITGGDVELADIVATVTGGGVFTLLAHVLATR